MAGWPGAGKTTLARALAERLGLPLFAKDEVKEQLFDALGTGDRDWSKRLGVAAFALLNQIAQATLAAGGSLVLEANFDAAFAGPALRDVVTRCGATPFVIRVTAAPDVLSARFRRRAGTPDRHVGHLDADMFEEIDAVVQRPYVAPDLGGAHITVDLSDLALFDAALDAIAEALQVAVPDAPQHWSRRSSHEAPTLPPREPQFFGPHESGAARDRLE